jgi:hypothetical protein
MLKARPAAFEWEKVGLAACKMLQGESVAALKRAKGWGQPYARI